MDKIEGILSSAETVETTEGRNKTHYASLSITQVKDLAHQIRALIPQGDEEGLLTEAELTKLEIDFNRNVYGVIDFSKLVAKTQQALSYSIKDAEVASIFEEFERGCPHSIEPAIKLDCDLCYQEIKSKFTKEKE